MKKWLVPKDLPIYYTVVIGSELNSMSPITGFFSYSNSRWKLFFFPRHLISMLPNNSGVLRERKKSCLALDSNDFSGWLVGWWWYFGWGSCPELRVAGLAGDAAAAHTSSSRSAIGFLLLAIMWPLTAPRADKGCRRAQTMATASLQKCRPCSLVVSFLFFLTYFFFQSVCLLITLSLSIHLV